MALSVIKLAFLYAILWACKTEYEEGAILSNVNGTFFYAILCLFCGFEARDWGFSSLIVDSLEEDK